VLALDAANPKSYVSGSTTWNDLSGNGNNGTLLNNPTYNLTNNGNIVTSGSAYISTPLVLPSPSTTPTTFEIVFKNNSTTTQLGLIGASEYQTSGIGIGCDGQNFIRCTYNSASVSSEFQFSYDSSVVSMCTFIFNGTNRSVYRNGSFVQSNNASFNAAPSTSSIAISYNRQSGWPTGQLNIYSTKIYNRALSEAEIKQNYNALKSRFNLN
jgi:hypothetical protein